MHDPANTPLIPPVAPPVAPPADPGATAHTPSAQLLGHLRQALQAHPPFSQMAQGEVDYFLAHAQQHYFAPDELLLGPDSGPVEQLLYIRQGAVTGTPVGGGTSAGVFAYEAGDLFPVGAALVGRAVRTHYRATADTFVLALPVAAMHALAQRSAAFAEQLRQRTAQFLALSRQALQATYAAQALTEQSMETPLGRLATRAVIACRPDTPLAQALATMHQARIGAMLVTDAQDRPLGILTRFDILGRITLAQVPLDQPMARVMVQPVLTLTDTHTAQDAALLMSRHGIRHVPITRQGRAIGMVSERDLFAMQRQSLKSVGTALRAAQDVAALQQSAPDIRRLARRLLGQGVQARQLTAMVSHLNDVLTERLLQLKAAEHGVDLQRLCWLSLGSEGRDEQTIATDQDNALILANDCTDAERARIRAFARDVNLALDACGYPLCQGGIMAGEADGCLTLDAWQQRFAQWIAQGAPQDLLHASIYFDFRALAGNTALAASLHAHVSPAAQHTPRFLKQLAMNALTRSVPLNWRGALDADAQGRLDLKLRGTAIFVDAARIYSLAHGVGARNTRQRLEAVGPQLALAPREYQAWVSGFEFLQMLRLRIQLDEAPPPAASTMATAPAPAAQPNHLALDTLNAIDRRMLRESMRMAHQLQQRLQLDYGR